MPIDPPKIDRRSACAALRGKQRFAKFLENLNWNSVEGRRGGRDGRIEVEVVARFILEIQPRVLSKCRWDGKLKPCGKIWRCLILHCGRFGILSREIRIVVVKVVACDQSDRIGEQCFRMDFDRFPSD